MRTLSSTLTTAQKAQAGEELYKVVLVKGATRYAYTIDDKLKGWQYTEEGILQKVDFTLRNDDGTLTSLDLRGYTVYSSQGYRTGLARSAWVANTAYAVDDIVRPTTANGYQYRCSVAGTSHAVTEPTWSTTLGAVQTDGTVTWEVDGRSGDEYSRMAPCLIVAPEVVSSINRLDVVYAAVGSGNQLSEDRASVEYTPDSSNTDTWKTIISAIMGATMACYNHTTAITVVYDTEDDLLDVYQPADSFRVSFRETRKSKIEEILSYTKCVGKFEADGKLHIRKLINAQAATWVANTAYLVGDTVKPTSDNNHIYKCTTAGTSHATTEPTWVTTEGQTNNDGTVVWTLTYDYSYNDIDMPTGHVFYSDSHRRRIVSPNKITVASDPNHETQYTGTATDTDSNDLLDKRDYFRLRLPSNAVALRIANARITNLQRQAERGWIYGPPNVGQEMYDLVRVTDTRSGAIQIGNVGFIQHQVSVKEKGLQVSMVLRLGSPTVGVPMGATPSALTGVSEYLASSVSNLFTELGNVRGDVESLSDSLLNFILVVGGFQHAVTFIIDGGGAVITTGQKGHIRLPFAGTIVSATLLADQSGSMVVDIWKDTYANFAPTDADSITASAPPTLSTAQKSLDTTLSGWTRSFSYGDILAFNVDSCTTITRATLTLMVKR